MVKSRNNLSQRRVNYYYRHKEHEKERSKKYYQDENVKQKIKEYQSSEEYKQKMRNYYLQHREEILAKRKQQRLDRQNKKEHPQDVST